MGDQERKWKFDTLALHAGQQPDPATGARAVPIYATTSYVFDSTQQAADLFALKSEGNIYSRMMNPTNDVFEKRMAILEGGVGALATASGQAAITLALTNICGAGDEVVSSSKLYGGTYNLLAISFARMGIQVRFVDPADPEAFAAAAGPSTKAFFTETIGNPSGEISDLEAIAQVAHRVGVPLVVDNTFATPFLCRPLEWGADVVVHSATKFIGGHGTVLGGVIIDGGRFNWDNGRFAELVDPDPSYHGVSYQRDVGAAAYIVKARVQLMRDLGPCLSPFNAFLLLQGVETLPLRMRRHCDNAQAVASFLEKHPWVSWVSYPGLPSHSSYHLADKYLPAGCGSIFTFGVKGGVEAGVRLIDSLRLFSHLANVGDAKSLVIHPASTTHQQLSVEEQAAAGVTPDMVRLSVGLEDAEDLIADLDAALNALAE